MTRTRMGRRLWLGVSLSLVMMGLVRPSDAAADIVVINTNDSGGGSLRQAIVDAASGETIRFDLDLTGCPCTIALTSGLGELVIDKDLTIVGPGANLLTISGEGASRVFRIAPNVVVHLEGLQVWNGNGAGGGSNGFGGGILNDGTLMLLNTIVAGNSTTNRAGGGVYSSSLGSLTVRNSIFTLNRGSSGGAIRSDGLLLMSGSTLTRNVAEGGGGGGVFVTEGTIVGSTIAGNATTSYGGGVFVLLEGSLTLVNCTISGNSARFGGGGFAEGLPGPATTLTLINTTVTANTATSGDSGGGLINQSATLVLNNSIVAGNSLAEMESFGPVINNSSRVGGNVGTILNPALANNGGPTLTHALVPGSPAINAGDTTFLPLDTFDVDGDGNTGEVLPIDQRGAPRVFGGGVDQGAFEVVCTAIGVTPPTLPSAPAVGVAFSQALSASGGTGPYMFEATGQLPPGLALDSDSGVLSGTPTASGTYSFTVTVTDAFGCIGTQTYTVTLADPGCGIVLGPTTLKTPYLATLYYQPLSVTPSGQYTVTISVGALPQGVYLFAIGHHWFLGGIPTKPGEYTVTLSAKKKNSPCAPTRTYTVTVPATVLPQLTCVAKTGAKQYTARFGYDNSTDAPVAIPVGTNNYFTPGAQDRGQVTTFQKGRVANAFSVMFTVRNNNTDLALWYLRGPDGVRRPVNITTATSRCQ